MAESRWFNYKNMDFRLYLGRDITNDIVKKNQSKIKKTKKNQALLEFKL